MGAHQLPCGGCDAHVKAFVRLGWEVARQSGSHVILKKAGSTALLSIPKHGGKDVKRMLLASLVKLAGITEAAYIDAFKGR